VFSASCINRTLEKIIITRPVNEYDREIRRWEMLAKVFIGAGLLIIAIAYALVTPEISSLAVALIGTFASGCGVGILALITWLGRAR
jgi:hypothetical protein